MSWATIAIEKLKQGESVSIKPHGNSMTGRIEDGQEVTVFPLTFHDPEVDDVVLARVGKNEYLHLVKARKGNQYLIGNNRGRINGWIGRSSIFGIVHDP